MPRLLVSGLVIIMVSFPGLLQAQPKHGQQLLDSLLAEALKMNQDTNGVKLMNSLSEAYYIVDPDEGLKWADKALTLAQKINWRKGEQWAYNAFGSNYYTKDALPEALDAYFKSLRMAEDLENQEQVGVVSGNIGNIYSTQKKYDKALEYFFKALKIAEDRKDEERVQTALCSIGIVYGEQGKPDEALVYLKKALTGSEAAGDQYGTLINTGNIGSLYAGMGQYAAALPYFFKALRLSEETGNPQGIATNLCNIGASYHAIAADSVAPQPDSLVPAGRAANISRAIDYLNKGIAASREGGFFESLPGAYGNLSEALALQGDYQGALAAYKKSKEVADSLYNTANNEAITNLETKREVQLKDKDIQIAKLKKRNERVLFAGGFVVLLLILGILFRNYKRQQQSNKLLASEKKRSDDLLLNILPAEVAEELKDNGESAARHYEEVSVLFTDFVGFTAIAEALSAQALVQELHECFTGFDAIIVRNGLEKIKTIGDAYMAVCGLPHSDPRHAQRTVQAALEIRDFMEARDGKSFRIRIGINSGHVVAGIVGVKKFAYDIWGDTVNTAARMEQSGEPGRINISQSTYELVREEFACEHRGKIAAKNKGAVEMYFVISGITASLHLASSGPTDS